MGTNYYHRTNICEHCDRYDENHIGKSSGGWVFSFHGERNDVEWNFLGGGVIVSLDDWKARLKGGKIFDEYGDEISVEDVESALKDMVKQDLIICYMEIKHSAPKVTPENQ